MVGQPPTRLLLTIINHIVTIIINHILTRYINHWLVGQPPTRISLTIINHIVTIIINHILTRYINHWLVGQPPTRISLTIINHIVTIIINHILTSYINHWLVGQAPTSYCKPRCRKVTHPGTAQPGTGAWWFLGVRWPKDNGPWNMPWICCRYIYILYIRIYIYILYLSLFIIYIISYILYSSVQLLHFSIFQVFQHRMLQERVSFITFCNLIHIYIYTHARVVNPTVSLVMNQRYLWFGGRFLHHLPIHASWNPLRPSS